jgi:trigger factor
MQITREDLNPCTVQLTIVCEPDEVRQGFDKAYKQLAKQVKLPGFRPGHAPRAMLEKVVNKEAVMDAAAEAIVNQSFRKALEQEKLELDPGTRPSVDLKKLDPESNEAEYVAKVPLPPVIELGDYKKIPVEQPSADVTDEDIEYQIEELRKRRATREAVTERGVQEGDVAVVNVKPDGEAEGRNFMTIVGKTFPQLDQALMGMRVEEMKSLDVTFPETFQEKDWAGKPMHVQVTLNSLSSVKLPEVDEEFAQSLKVENVDELRERLREGIARAKEQMIREMVYEQLLEKLHERSKVQTSDNMWEGLAARRMQETAEEQQKAGKTLEQYAQENGMTVDELTQAWKDKAKMHVERALLIREIFTKEKMKLTNDELNRELVAMADEFEVEPEEMVRMLKENQALDELHFRAISHKVSEFLLKNAEVKETAPA